MFEALKIMIIGMATVFIFLVLLIGSINLVASYFIRNADRFLSNKDSVEIKNDDTNIAIALASIKAKRG